MSELPAGSPQASALDRFAQQRPDLVFMAPYLLYLVLLMLKDWSVEYNWAASLVRGVLPMLLVWLFWKHLRPWGASELHVAIPAALLTAAGWFYGQYLFNWLGVPARLPLPMFEGQPDDPPLDPRSVLGDGGLFWLTAIAHVAVASTTVGFVEEIFWRSFLLRALIDWNEFERMPLGRFTWLSFLGTALLSALQHPDNWLVSVACWMAWNLLMYWRRSLLCLVWTHCFTNLFLYAWVLYAALQLGDSYAWMHLSLAGKP